MPTGIGIAIRPTIGGSSAGPSSSFALRTSAAATAGGQSLSFTRATTASVTDHEGIIRTALSGELRFNRARRVRNIIAVSESFSSIGSVTLTTGQSGPSATNATKVVYAAAASTSRVMMNGGALSSMASTAVVSVWMKGEVGGEQVKIYNGNSNSPTLILTTSWVRYSFANSLATFGPDLWIYANSGTPTIYTTQWQFEDVTGQTNQNPSEYVSKGVLSTPFHGAFVDGVKYFDTANGNTVLSNVVTEATGAALTDSDSDPIGALTEPAATNLCLRSEDLSNAAWSKVRCAETINATAGPTGATLADKIVEDGTAASTHDVRQTIATTAATVYTYSVFLKADTRTRATLRCESAGADSATFDLSAGSIVAQGTANNSWIEAFGNGWYRCSVKFTAAGASSLFYLGLAQTAYATANLQSYNGDGVSGLFWFGANVTATPVPMSYIPSTTAAVTRNADALTAPLAVYSDTQGTVSIEAQTAYQAGASGQRLTLRTGCPLIVHSTSLGYFDSTNNVAFAITSFSLATRKTCSGAWGSSAIRIAATAKTAYSGNYDGSWFVTGSVAVGLSTSDGTSVPVVIRNLKFWSRKLSTAEQDAVVGN